MFILPIKFNDELNTLHRAIKANEVIEKDVEKVKELHGKSSITYKIAESLTKKYRDSLIYNAEAERIELEYEKGENLIKNISQQVKDHKLTDDEAVQQYETLNSLEIDFGLRMEKPRIDLWEKVTEIIVAQNEKYEPLKNRSKFTAQQNAIILCCESFLSALKDAYDIYDLRVQKPSESINLNNIITVLEELGEKVEERLKELSEITDIKQLNKFDSFVVGFVSLSSQIAAHKKKLSEIKNYKPSFKSIIRHLHKTTGNLNTSMNKTSSPGSGNKRGKKAATTTLAPSTKLEEEKAPPPELEEPAAKGKRKLKTAKEQVSEEESLLDTSSSKKVKTESGQKVSGKTSEIDEKTREKTSKAFSTVIENNP